MKARIEDVPWKDARSDTSRTISIAFPETVKWHGPNYFRYNYSRDCFECCTGVERRWVKVNWSWYISPEYTNAKFIQELAKLFTKGK